MRLMTAGALVGVLALLVTSCGPTAEATPEAVQPDTATPGPQVTETPRVTPSVAATEQVTTPAANLTPTGRPTVTATPTLTAPQYLAIARDGYVFLGGLRGEEPEEIAQLELPENWDFRLGRLALAQGHLVQMVDLVRGTHWSDRVSADVEVVSGEVLWDLTGNRFVYLQVTDDGGTLHTVLEAFDGVTGRSLGVRQLPEGARAMALFYGSQDDLVWLGLLGEKGEIKAIEAVSMSSDEPGPSYALRGRLPVAMDHQGRRVAYFAPDSASICVRELDHGTSPQCVALPAGQSPTSYAWSAAGDRLALMLQPEPDEDGGTPEAAGLWVLALQDESLHQVLPHIGLMSEILAWSPEDEMLLARHSGGTIPEHIYLIRPDGGDRRILPTSDRLAVLGWMPPRAPDAPLLRLDAWLARFAVQAADPQALADAAAQWLAASQGKDDAELTELLQAYVRTSGVRPDLAGPQVFRVDDRLHVVQLPPMAIYVCEEGRAYPIASGHQIQDVRQDGGRLGVIYATIGASSVTPDFVLAGRDEDGWHTAWTPLGQQYWIATDGEIAFAGEGIDRLLVRGSSFGVEPSEGDAFRQCHACLHRWFRTEWVRSGDTYALAQQEVIAKPREEALWTLTERTPYAVLHQALWRLRTGRNSDELVDGQTRTQLEQLGLTDPQRLLVGEQETAQTVTFADLDTGTSYRAEIRQGRLSAVLRVND